MKKIAECLSFPAAIQRAGQCGDAVVHLMGEQPKYGYGVDRKGNVTLATRYTYSESVKDLIGENWMVSQDEEDDQ